MEGNEKSPRAVGRITWNIFERFWNCYSPSSANDLVMGATTCCTLEIQLVLLPLALTVRFRERVLSPEGHTTFINTTSVPPVATSWENKALPSIHILYFSICLSTHLRRGCAKVAKRSWLVAYRNQVGNWVPRRSLVSWGNRLQCCQGQRHHSPHPFRSFCWGGSGLSFCSRSIYIQLHGLLTRELFSYRVCKRNFSDWRNDSTDSTET